jgi:3-hydroxybutyryl-CoA dehydrogenase
MGKTAQVDAEGNAIEPIPAGMEPLLDTIEHVVIVGGGGLMGSGIAQVVARSGFRLTIVEVDEAALERGLARIARGFDRGIEVGVLTESDAESARARIGGSTHFEESAAVADHVIETVAEVLDLKTNVLCRLDEVCRDDVVIASNTSQFSISQLAAATNRADRVIGSHWFNPPPAMNLIELVRGLETSDATLELALALARAYGKNTIVCMKDTTGFITSRLVALLIAEAARIVDEGIATVEDVNAACILAFNHALGPLDTADLSGLDTVQRVLDALTDTYGDRFRVPSGLRALVNAGHYGRKTGRGFRSYSMAR